MTSAHVPLLPPTCPNSVCQGQDRLLWKDTTYLSKARPDNWRWHCTGCREMWIPSPEHRELFR